MRFTTLSRLFAVLAVMALLVPGVVLAQSTITGAVAGTVTDQSGAVLPDVPVTIKSVDQGFSTSTKTNAQGFYQFQLINPGTYAITVAAANFKTLTTTTTVSVGQNTIVNAKLEVGSAGTTVEVSGEAPLLQTESTEISTTFNERAISEVPNPGNDLSFIAQTAPGSVMNTGSGYGNFSNFGVSASSNLFTLNGMYDNDPFLNLNNSGATNLLLGQNEVAEATVVTNGYSGQYGGFIGANVNYITKSGSNNWHGNANYFWNGRVMNANDYFHTNYQDHSLDQPRGFVNANQYAASFGGPIIKNKAFFFWNYEGLRVIIPVSNTNLHAPTQDFQNAIIDNLNNTGFQQSVPFYQSMFGFYNNARGISKATPGYAGNTGDPTGCQSQVYTDTTPGGLEPLGTVFGNVPGGMNCVNTFANTVGNFTHEYLTSGRFDFNVTKNDKIFIRLQEDVGTQATATDALDPIFDAISYQPEYQGQVSWNRPIGAKSVNSLLFAMQYYRAIFGPPNLNTTLAAFPTTVELGDGSLSTVGGEDYVWPQGRNVTGYQIVDDYSYSMAKHTLKAGIYFHRNLISDHDYGLFTSGLAIPFTLDDFYGGGQGPNFATSGGGTSELLQNFANALSQPIKLYQLGWYVQDDWKAKSNLKLTFALRMDHNAVPECGTSCFARFSGPFASVADPTGTVPYNQQILTGQKEAFTGFTPVAFQPRFGFSWSPEKMKNTVIRGGIGIFMDTFPGQIADSLSSNLPLVNGFTLIGSNLSPQENNQGNLFSLAAASNAALLTGFHSGQNYNQINTAVINSGNILGFFAPGFSNPGHIVAPTTQEWNIEVQQGIGNSTVFTLNYVGSHGIHETAGFNGVNGFCPTSFCPNGWPGLPATAPDPAYSTVTEYNTVGISNYNGLNASIQHRFSRGLQMQFNYTWGHSMDEVSNGGFNPFIDVSGASILSPANGQNLRQFNYGNADYDTRHSLNANYVYELPKGPTALLKGWQLSGTFFFRTGFPYTVTNSGVTNTLSGFGFGGPAFANYSGPSGHQVCRGPSGSLDGGPVACINTADFPDSIPNGGNPANQLAEGTMNQTRNQFYGPHYFDTDMTIMKYTRIPHWETAKLGIGAQFFNLLNHPNFQSPINNINNGSFGTVLGTVNPPTSILGSFLGGDASTRLIQLTAKFNF
jgi:hypothetical protein